MVSVTPDGISMVSDRIVKSRFFVKFPKDLINMVSVTPDGISMVSDRIVKSRFFVKFHRSGPAIIISFSTIMEHVSYPSKKLLTKPKTSSRW